MHGTGWQASGRTRRTVAEDETRRSMSMRVVIVDEAAVAYRRILTIAHITLPKDRGGLNSPSVG